MEYIIESSLDTYFSMGIEEWVFHFLELMEKMTKISSSPSVRVKSKVIELEDSVRQL
jgi:hypothetical protein